MKFKLWKQAIAITAFTVSGVTGCSTAAFAYDMDNYGLDLAYTQTHRQQVCSTITDSVRSDTVTTEQSKVLYLAYGNSPLTKEITLRMYDYVVSTRTVPVDLANDVRMTSAIYVILEEAVVRGATRKQMIDVCTGGISREPFTSVNIAAGVDVIEHLDDE